MGAGRGDAEEREEKGEGGRRWAGSDKCLPSLFSREVVTSRQANSVGLNKQELVGYLPQSHFISSYSRNEKRMLVKLPPVTVRLVTGKATFSYQE